MRQAGGAWKGRNKRHSWILTWRLGCKQREFQGGSEISSMELGGTRRPREGQGRQMCERELSVTRGTWQPVSQSRHAQFGFHTAGHLFCLSHPCHPPTPDTRRPTSLSFNAHGRGGEFCSGSGSTQFLLCVSVVAQESKVYILACLSPSGISHIQIMCDIMK